jgi:surface antigen
MSMQRAIVTLTAVPVIGLSLLAGAAEATTHSGTGYPPGQCTAYVASLLSWIPSDWGNADEWLSDASGAGFTTVSGSDLEAVRPGDVAVMAANVHTNHGRASSNGHVGIVTALDQSVGMVTLSSENWPEGDGSPSSLTFDASDIEGYVLAPAGTSMPPSLRSRSSPAVLGWAPALCGWTGRHRVRDRGGWQTEIWSECHEPRNAAAEISRLPRRETWSTGSSSSAT